MSEKQKKETKLYYTIGEVAEIVGENISAVRYWEQNFKVIRPTRNKKGNRLFSAKDVANLKVIKFLVKEQGMTLKGASEKMEAYSTSKEEFQEMPITTDMDTQAEILDRLKNIRSYLLDIEKYL